MASGNPKWLQSRPAQFVGMLGAIDIVWMFLHLGTIPALRHAIMGDQALGWPSTSGTLTELKRVEHDGGAYVLFAAPFDVGGTSYVCTRSWAGWRPEAESSLARDYKVGDSIKIYYDPADPTRSCLTPGVRKDAGWVFLLSLGPILILVGGWIWNGTSRRGYA